MVFFILFYFLWDCTLIEILSPALLYYPSPVCLPPHPPSPHTYTHSPAPTLSCFAPPCFTLYPTLPDPPCLFPAVHYSRAAPCLACLTLPFPAPPHPALSPPPPMPLHYPTSPLFPCSTSLCPIRLFPVPPHPPPNLSHPAVPCPTFYLSHLTLSHPAFSCPTSPST